MRNFQIDNFVCWLGCQKVLDFEDHRQGSFNATVHPFCRVFDFSSIRPFLNAGFNPNRVTLTKALAMFKPTQPLFRRLRRLALTTKQVNGGFYKGTGSGSMGRHTKHGGYIIDWRKVRTYVVPRNLEDFKVHGLILLAIKQNIC